MTSRSRTRSRSQPRVAYDRRSQSPYRSPTPRAVYSRSPSIERAPVDDGEMRGRSHQMDSEYRAPSLSRGRSYSRGSRGSRVSRSRSRIAGLSPHPNPKSTKIVVERLTKNVTEDHLWEIFGEYGKIEDLDLPISRQYGTNRGTAYILYAEEAFAEEAIAHMHEAQLDSATINVSIVLPWRKLSPPPPIARRGANVDPRNPPPHMRGGPGGLASGGRGRRPSPGSGPSRYGPRSDTYRPFSRSRSRSPMPVSSGGRRYRSRSRSYSSRSRSRTPPTRGGYGGRGGRRRNNGYDDGGHRSPSRTSYDRGSPSRNRDWGRR